MTEITVSKVRDMQANREGQRLALYHLSSPIEYGYEPDCGKCPRPTAEYVAISAIESVGRDGLPETYIFAADAEGVILSWGELDGSYQGGTSHEKAIDGAGWVLND